MIELRLLITVPLKTETSGVVLGVNKACYTLQVGIHALAGRADKTCGLIVFKFRAATEATQNRLQVSGQGRLHRLFRDRHKPPGSDAAYSAAGAPSRVLVHFL